MELAAVPFHRKNPPNPPDVHMKESVQHSTLSDDPFGSAIAPPSMITGPALARAASTIPQQPAHSIPPGIRGRKPSFIASSSILNPRPSNGHVPPKQSNGHVPPKQETGLDSYLRNSLFSGRGRGGGRGRGKRGGHADRGVIPSLLNLPLKEGWGGQVTPAWDAHAAMYEDVQQKSMFPAHAMTYDELWNALGAGAEYAHMQSQPPPEPEPVPAEHWKAVAAQWLHDKESSQSSGDSQKDDEGSLRMKTEPQWSDDAEPSSTSMAVVDSIRAAPREGSRGVNISALLASLVGQGAGSTEETEAAPAGLEASQYDDSVVSMDISAEDDPVEIRSEEERAGQDVIALSTPKAATKGGWMPDESTPALRTMGFDCPQLLPSPPIPSPTSLPPVDPRVQGRAATAKGAFRLPPVRKRVHTDISLLRKVPIEIPTERFEPMKKFLWPDNIFSKPVQPPVSEPHNNNKATTWRAPPLVEADEMMEIPSPDQSLTPAEPEAPLSPTGPVTPAKIIPCEKMPTGKPLPSPTESSSVSPDSVYEIGIGKMRKEQDVDSAKSCSVEETPSAPPTKTSPPSNINTQSTTMHPGSAQVPSPIIPPSPRAPLIRCSFFSSSIKPQLMANFPKAPIQPKKSERGSGAQGNSRLPARSLEAIKELSRIQAMNEEKKGSKAPDASPVGVDVIDIVNDENPVGDRHGRHNSETKKKSGSDLDAASRTSTKKASEEEQTGTRRAAAGEERADIDKRGSRNDTNSRKRMRDWEREDDRGASKRSRPRTSSTSSSSSAGGTKRPLERSPRGSPRSSTSRVPSRNRPTDPRLRGGRDGRRDSPITARNSTRPESASSSPPTGVALTVGPIVHPANMEEIVTRFGSEAFIIVSRQPNEATATPGYLVTTLEDEEKALAALGLSPFDIGGEKVRIQRQGRVRAVAKRTDDERGNILLSDETLKAEMEKIFGPIHAIESFVKEERGLGQRKHFIVTFLEWSAAIASPGTQIEAVTAASGVYIAVPGYELRVSLLE